MEYTDQYFISGIEDYKEYMQILNNKFAVSEDEIKNIETFIGHGHSILTGVSGMFSGMIDKKEKREPMLSHLKLLQAKVLSDQLRHVLNGDRLAINKLGGYFPIKPDEEIEFIETKNDIYIESDIKIKKWHGGSHFYAKVGNIDVVDEFDNVKWKSEKKAKEKSIKFIHNLNNNNGDTN